MLILVTINPFLLRVTLETFQVALMIQVHQEDLVMQVMVRVSHSKTWLNNLYPPFTK